MTDVPRTNPPSKPYKMHRQNTFTAIVANRCNPAARFGSLHLSTEIVFLTECLMHE